MGTARYPFQMIGPANDAAMTALPERSQAEVDPAGTAVCCWVPAIHHIQTQSSSPTAA
jgi:hypothetical protein